MTDPQISYQQFVMEIPPERRGEIEQVWQTVRNAVPAGYQEEITPKFLTFKAGDEWYVTLANQKNYISLYLMPIDVFPELKARLSENAKNLKCGKSCINFKRADELPLEIIGEILGAHDPAHYLEQVRSVKHKGR